MSRIIRCCIGLLWLGAALTGVAEPVMPWNLDALYQAPASEPAEGFDEAGVRALYFEGLPYQGKPTKVFAWYGVPEHAEGTKLPAMVLVHGGGGTAFAEWVRLWTSRGYAAIAMDTCGAVPRGTYGHWDRAPQPGPPGWGGFAEADLPLEEQWPYHAVADVLLAHSLIRSFPEVDTEKVGITGISWGGYLTCIVAGVDDRFVCAAPVYGCGHLAENSAWSETLAALPPATADRWTAHWDPGVYLTRVIKPMLWVTGTNDFAYPLDSLQKSYDDVQGPVSLAIRLRMPHGHGGAGENPEELHAFFDQRLKGDTPMPRIAAERTDTASGEYIVTYESAEPIVRAELLYTKATGPWQDRLWESVPATLDVQARTATQPLPEGVTVYFMNLYDAQDRVVSSRHTVANGAIGAAPETAKPPKAPAQEPTQPAPSLIKGKP